MLEKHSFVNGHEWVVIREKDYYIVLQSYVGKKELGKRKMSEDEFKGTSKIM